MNGLEVKNHPITAENNDFTLKKISIMLSKDSLRVGFIISTSVSSSTGKEEAKLKQHELARGLQGFNTQH